MDELVICTRDDRGVVTVSLNRPGVHNAFDDRLIATLSCRLDEAVSDPSCRVLVLRSEGKSFSAGADLGWMNRMAAASEQENLDDALELGRLMRKLDRLSVPTVARVQGAAFGGAVGLVACCDIAVASTHARFALSEVRLGLIPAVISPYVVAAIGPRAARRYFLSAERMGAEQAMRLGLVHEVVEPEELDARVQDMVAALLMGGPKAQGEAKELVRDVCGGRIDDEMVRETSRRIAEVRRSCEGGEGVSAFLEHREPSWVRGSS